MKILICTDGSEHSKKAVHFAAEMVGFCNIDEAAIIHVYESTPFLPDYWHSKYPFSSDEEKRLQELDKRIQEDRKSIFADAVKLFEEKQVPLKTIFKVGHPAGAIATEAADGKYDIVVIGRRGMSSVKNLFIGSVSSAVLQVVKSNVLIVK